MSQRERALAYFLQTIANGLHNGALYALLAYGYVLTYSVTKRANLAHGAVFAFSGQILVLGATVGYTVLWMTLPAALAFGALTSIVLTVIVLMVLALTIVPRFIDLAPNMMITTTLGVAIVLMEGARIGADTRDYWLPPLLNARVGLSPLAIAPTLTALQIVNIAAIAAVIAASQVVLTRTLAGRALRAVSDDPVAANLCGIDAAKVRRNAVLAGGALAAVGGMLATLFFGNMSFGAGLFYGLKVLFIASAGGFSKPLHAAVGAFLFGEAEALWDGYFPIVWRELVFYSLLALLLCLRTEHRLTQTQRF
jgi:branched-chain amino acid transport system permease protein